MNARALLVLLVVVGLPACAGSSDRAASSTPSTPIQSAAASPSPSPAASASGSSVGCPAAALRLDLNAHHEKFSTDCLAVPDGQAFTISFDNRDKLSHNVSILTSTGAPVFHGDIVEGPDSTTYEVQALDAGSYIFHCDVHPQIMRGTLIVSG